MWFCVKLSLNIFATKDLMKYETSILQSIILEQSPQMLDLIRKLLADIRLQTKFINEYNQSNK